MIGVPAFSGVRVWQDLIVLPTYLAGSPDAALALDIFTLGRNWYLYTTRTNLPGKHTAQEWRQINLENKYLSCAFLPDLGGHLYSCTDKLNGHAVFTPILPSRSLRPPSAAHGPGSQWN